MYLTNNITQGFVVNLLARYNSTLIETLEWNKIYVTLYSRNNRYEIILFEQIKMEWIRYVDIGYMFIHDGIHHMQIVIWKLLVTLNSHTLILLSLVEFTD